MAEPLVDETMEAEMPADDRADCMAERLSLRSMVTLFPFMVTVPERSSSEFPRRASTAVDLLVNASLSAPSEVAFLILVPLPLNPRLVSVSVDEPFAREIPEAPVLLLVSTSLNEVEEL